MESENSTPEKLVESTKLSIDQIRRGMEWLKLKGLAEVKEIEKITLKLGKNGLDAKNNGLPERKLVNNIQEKPKSFDEVQNLLKSDFNAAIANAKKNDWIQIEKGENPDIDVSFQYLRIFFEPDDNKLKQIYEDYKSGKMLTGELKSILIEKINGFLSVHQEKREKAKDQLDKFLLDNS